MRLVDDEIKTLIAEDVKNPEVYDKIYELAYYYLKRNRLLNKEDDYVGVATLMAEDLYIMVCNGKEIRSWVAYIRYSYMAYIRQWKKMFCSQIIEVDNDNPLRESIYEMCGYGSSSSTLKDYKMMIDNVYLESINRIIDSILVDSRYYEFTSGFLNAQLTLRYSLLAGKFVSLFQNKADEMYTRMIYNYLKDVIKENICDIDLTEYVDEKACASKQLYEGEQDNE